MKKVVLTTAARFPEAAQLIAVSLYAGLMRFPNASDEGLAQIGFCTERDSPYRALFDLALKDGLLPPELATKFLSVHGQGFARDLINELTVKLRLAELVEGSPAIRLAFVEDDAHKLLAVLGVDSDEKFELVRDLGWAMVHAWPFQKI